MMEELAFDYQHRTY